MATRRPVVNVDGVLAELPVGDTVDGAPASGAHEVTDWAALMALSGVPDGRVYTVLAPVCTGGLGGTMWRRTGSVWRPAHRQVVWRNDSQIDGVAGGTTADQVLAATRFAAGVMRYCARVQIRHKHLWSAADTNGRTYRTRLGVTGTASDAAIAGGAGAPGANRTTAHTTSFFASTDTAVESPGASLGSSSGYNDDVYSATGGGSWQTTNSVNTTLSVPSLSSTELYVSIAVQQGAAPTATVSLGAGSTITIE